MWNGAAPRSRPPRQTPANLPSINLLENRRDSKRILAICGFRAKPARYPPAMPGMKEHLDEQALQLNAQIARGAPALMGMLSRRGRAMYFPKLGIISQSAEASGKDINASIGIALGEDGAPMALPGIARNCSLDLADIVAYAPSSGKPAIRRQWKEMLVEKNPLLSGKLFSLPVVTCALTHGLSLCAFLFCDEGDIFITPDLYWENYDLIFGVCAGARMVKYPLFKGGGFNVAGLGEALRRGGPSKKIVCLNFPNNPTGYTPSNSEAAAIAAELRSAAEDGNRLVVLLDDAYFGLVYEDGIFRESGFGLLCDIHPNILAVKLDGPTKEDYAWGLRVGFITYGMAGAGGDVYAAMEAKTAGAIRGAISNAPNISQSLLLKAYAAPDYKPGKELNNATMKARYEAVKSILAGHPEYRSRFEPLPFNSGYFMCVRMLAADPEQVRRILLERHSTGVIVMNNLVRIAFSSTPLAKLPVLFENIYAAAGAAATPSGAVA